MTEFTNDIQNNQPFLLFFRIIYAFSKTMSEGKGKKIINFVTKAYKVLQQLIADGEITDSNPPKQEAESFPGVLADYDLRKA